MKNLLLISILFLFSVSVFSQSGAANGENYIINNQYNGSALGLETESGGSYSFAAGYKSKALADGSFALGKYVTTNQAHTWVIGNGLSDGIGMLNNAIPNSLMIGFNTTRPSFFVEPFIGGKTGGRVGIHTTAPRSTLDVKGELTVDAFTMPTGAAPGYVLTSADGGGSVKWAELPTGSGGPIGGDCEWTPLNGNIYYNKSGNVGIGKTNPFYDLDVNGTVAVTGFKMDVNATNGYVLTSDGSGNAHWAELPAGSTGSYNLTGQVESDNAGNASLTVQAIDAQTNVSTITETDKIIYSDGINLKKTQISVLENYMQANLDFGDGSGTIINGGLWEINETNKQDIYYNGGKVGIGTDSPDEALHVTGTIKAENGLLLEGYRNNITFGSDPTSSFHIVRDIGTLEKIFNISAENKVGIGVLEADEKLHVNGNVLVENDIASKANISAGGYIKTKSYVNIFNTSSQLFFGQDGFPSSFSLIKSVGSTPGKDQDDIEILTVGENNFVGILTDGEPGAELEVNGEIILKEELQFNQGFDAQISFGKSNSTKKFQIVSLSTAPPIDKSTIRGICIDAYGNLGVGIDNPSTDLEVAGTIKTNNFQMTANAASGRILQSSTNGNASWVDPSTIINPVVWEEDQNGNVYRQNGLVGIGTTPVDGYALAVNGSINAKLIKVTLTVPESDYVFENDYELMPLQELETYVKTNKHLPEVMSADEFARDGYSLGEMDDILLRKVEELTLYTIDQDKTINQLSHVMQQQQELLEKQQKLIDQLLNEQK